MSDATQNTSIQTTPQATAAAGAPEARAQARSMALAMPTTATGALQARNYGEAIEVAKMFAHSGMVPKQYEGNVGAILVAMQMGAELGLSPMASLQNIAVINGRPSLWGDAMLAVVMAHPDFVDIVETEGDGFAKCVIKRKNRSPVERVFTVDDAKRAGLWGKSGPWTQYPRRMLQQRARGFALRDAFPDALRGIISVEEARDYEPAIDGGAPEYTDAATIPEGTHKFGFAKKTAEEPAHGAEPPHDPTTGEVVEPRRVDESKRSRPAAAPAPAADPKAGF